jgi:hypothetical protein
MGMASIATVKDHYYAWALAEAQAQMVSGFPLVSLVRGSAAVRFAAYVEGLTRQQQSTLTVAMVKRFHSEATTRAGHYLTDDERVLLDSKDAAVLRPLPIEKDIEGDGFLPGKPRMHRSRFATQMRKHLTPDFGAPVLRRGASHWYESKLESWRIKTEVRLGSPPFYFQSIESEEGVAVLEHVSLLSWLGISSQTTWDLARDGDEAEVARSIAFLTRYLVDSAPEFLRGL